MHHEKISMNFNTVKYLLVAVVSALIINQTSWGMQLEKSSKAFPNKKLAEAIEAHSVEGVLQMLRAGAEINNTDGPLGRTPLHTAVIHSAPRGGLDVVRTLLDNGAQVNSVDSDAIRNTRTSLGRTPLHYAAADGYDEVALLLLERGAQVNASGGNYGQTPLHDAARHGRTPTARLLLDRGASINMRNICGETPLYQARTIFMVALLLERRAEINAMDNQNQTPLDHEVHELYADAARLLIRNGGHGMRYTPLQIAARIGDVEAVRSALSAGAAVNAPDHNGWTLLHIAAHGGYTAMFKLLLARGADSKQQNTDGNTPLHIAIEHGSLEIVALFAGMPNVLTMPNNRSETPLALARYRTLSNREILERAAVAAQERK